VDDFATLTNAPVRVTLGGEAFELRALTMADYGELQRALEARYDPLDVVKRHLGTGDFTVAQEKHLIASAIEQATVNKPTLFGETGRAWLRSPEGVAEVLYLLARGGRPDLTREHARGLFDRMTFADVERLFSVSEVALLIAGPKPPSSSGPRTTAPSPAPTSGGSGTA
jgi:hypothetical protein